MRLSLFQIDAFTSRLFGGNPAAVCPLPHWLDDEVLQQIAQENNLSETAFFVRKADGTYELRWFTPGAEVDLCGHATLAAAFAIFQKLEPNRDEVAFRTKSGLLAVHRNEELLTMDFPADSPRSVPSPPALLEGLGLAPREVLLGTHYYLAIYSSEHEVAQLRPHMQALMALEPIGVVASAPGTEVDFVSRFFGPKVGVPEDPVTGSAHCLAAPYWSRRLGKQELLARQISRRGGEIHCRMAAGGDRVFLSGSAVFYLQGEIQIPDKEAAA